MVTAIIFILVTLQVSDTIQNTVTWAGFSVRSGLDSLGKED